LENEILQDQSGHVDECVQPTDGRLVRQQIHLLGGAGYKVGVVEQNSPGDIHTKIHDEIELRPAVITQVLAGLAVHRKAPVPAIVDPEFIAAQSGGTHISELTRTRPETTENTPYPSLFAEGDDFAVSVVDQVKTILPTLDVDDGAEQIPDFLPPGIQGDQSVQCQPVQRQSLMSDEENAIRACFDSSPRIGQRFPFHRTPDGKE